MKDYESIARNNHRNGMNCASAVYNALEDLNKNKSTAPIPRSEGGKCGTVLAAEKIIREMQGSEQDLAEFDRIFSEKFGSLKCAELRGLLRNKCNDYVGNAALITAKLLEKA
ncbi:MAG: C-GCAxxG-C-C family protein [Lachnospiraceae bacterium]|nr:C-GCAxxG-C-C family protein [Lachnospiraceae bacterium]